MRNRHLDRIINPDKTVTISGNCVVTGKPYSVTVPEKGYNKWVAGELIQKAMPHVSEDDREFLITGLSPEGWEMMFSNRE